MFRSLPYSAPKSRLSQINLLSPYDGVCVRVCVCVCVCPPIQLLNQLTVFHETPFQHYASISSNLYILTICNKNMAVMRASRATVTLATLTFSS
jgi:hypothetical protein